MEKQTTIKDIAIALHLSTSTVSRALRDATDVKPETKKAVKALAEELDYQPNRLALSLLNRQTHTIGVIIPNLDYVLGSMVKGIDEVALKAGYTVMVCQSDESFGREIVNTKRLMESLVDGFIISVSSETKVYEHIKNIQNKKIPLVLFDRVINSLAAPKIRLDNVDGGIQAASVYNYLASYKSNHNIQLTGSTYVFDKPITINKNTTIKGLNKPITFKSSQAFASLFEITANNTLAIINLKVDANLLQVTNFISADSSGQCIHYAIKINNCSISNVTASVFLNAQKASYADEISITNTSFLSGNCNLFSLKDESDNKGFYNVEKMVVNKCLFENNKGFIINLYRGGTDESTMGPKLYFTNNKIVNCHYNTELIKLFGVQKSLLQNNSFSNSNTGKEVVVYLDNVRANHLQNNNQLNNSGRVKENKFVINLK